MSLSFPFCRNLQSVYLIKSCKSSGRSTSAVIHQHTSPPAAGLGGGIQEEPPERVLAPKLSNESPCQQRLFGLLIALISTGPLAKESIGAHRGNEHRSPLCRMVLGLTAEIAQVGAHMDPCTRVALHDPPSAQQTPSDRPNQGRMALQRRLWQGCSSHCSQGGNWISLPWEGCSPRPSGSPIPAALVAAGKVQSRN